MCGRKGTYKARVRDMPCEDNDAALMEWVDDIMRIRHACVADVTQMLHRCYTDKKSHAELMAWVDDSMRISGGSKDLRLQLRSGKYPTPNPLTSIVDEGDC